MANRRPLYYDSGNLREMSDQQLDQVRLRMFNRYLLNPSVTLSVVASGGNLGGIDDTRLKAGTYSTDPTATPTEAQTAEPTIYTVTFSRVDQQVTSNLTPPTNTNNVAFPAYYTPEGNIRSMTLQDMYDTFGHPVISGWTAADGSTEYPGLATGGAVYTIADSSTLSGYSEVSGSGTPVHIDTRANPAAYDAANIPVVEGDDSTYYTVQKEYFLHKKDYVQPSIVDVVKLETGGNIKQYNTAWGDNFDTILDDIIRYLAQGPLDSSLTGYAVRYDWGINGSGTGSTCGTAMTDSRLDGTGNYQTLYVGADDYRAQEFPDGSSQVISVYTLKVRQE